MDDRGISNAKKRVAAVPHETLQLMADAWFCTVKDCPNSLENGGLGQTSNDSADPVVLHCGHYLCQGCKQEMKQDPSARLPFTCSRHPGEEERWVQNYNYASDLDILPPAKHIHVLLRALRARGLRCATCRMESCESKFPEYLNAHKPAPQSFWSRITNLGKCGARDHSQPNMPNSVRYGYPADFMAVCLKCTDPPLHVSRMLDNRLQTVANLYHLLAHDHDMQLPKTIFCLLCAAKHHAYHGSNVIVLHELNRVNNGAVNPLPEITDSSQTLSSGALFNRFPWNLITVPQHTMGQIVSQMFRCQNCEEPFHKTDKPPVFRHCGHLSCHKCDGEIYAKVKTPKCGCTSDKYYAPQQIKTPTDLDVLMEAYDVATFFDCFNCNKNYPDSYILKHENRSKHYYTANRHRGKVQVHNWCLYCFFMEEDAVTQNPLGAPPVYQQGVGPSQPGPSSANI